MDWFKKLTGFSEKGYEDTRNLLTLDDGQLISKVNGARYSTGQLELVSLQTLRKRSISEGAVSERLKVSVVTGDVRKMHALPENAGAMFQVASQFNLLEMVSPEVRPEDGVTRYQRDHTQGPACAIAAGAATIYRNYFACVDGIPGQTETRQLDGLAGIGLELSNALNMPRKKLWDMQNGYALCTKGGLKAIAKYLVKLRAEEMDFLRGALCIGVHSDIEATEFNGPNRPLISQSLCSALPVAYSVRSRYWPPFAKLVLEAAYEATLWAAVLNAQRRQSNVVFLTLLGGGAFGNEPDWIYGAMRRSLQLVREFDLDVRVVSYSSPSRKLLSIVAEFR